MSREVKLSALIGRTVCDADGRAVGRLEEMRVEVALDEGSEYVVREVLVGHYGPFARLAGGHFSRYFLRLLRAFGRYRQIAVPWERIDLSDPERPYIRA